MKKIYIALLVLILLVSCTTQQPTTPEQPTAEPEEETPIETIQEIEETLEEPEEEIIKIPNDIKEILENGKTKLDSYSYNYKSPDSNLKYNMYVKGSNIKITLPEINTEEEGKFYNTIYFDTEKKTAQAYCIGYSACEGKVGKVKDLNYEKEYIETSLDWLDKVTEAEKVDERQIEGRNAVYLETNIGKITVESYYGFLYRIEDGNKVWEFTDAAFNSLKDSDVTAQ